MRKDAQEIETAEIADSDLENVSGGILGLDALGQTVGAALPALPLPIGLPSLSGGLPVETLSGGLQATGPIPGQLGLAGSLG